MFLFQGLSTIGVQQIDRVVEVVEETLKGQCLLNTYSFKFKENNTQDEYLSQFDR